MSCLVPSHSVHSCPKKYFVSCHTLSCPRSSFCPIMQSPVLSYPTPCGTDRPRLPLRSILLSLSFISCLVLSLIYIPALPYSFLVFSCPIKSIFFPSQSIYQLPISCPVLSFPDLSCTVVFRHSIHFSVL